MWRICVGGLLVAALLAAGCIGDNPDYVAKWGPPPSYVQDAQAPADLALPLDTSSPPEDAAPDLAVVEDLPQRLDLVTVPPDLARDPDLAVVLDFSTRPDLAIPPDLATPPDLVVLPDLSAPCAGWRGGPNNACWYVVPTFYTPCSTFCQPHGGFDQIGSVHTGSSVAEHFYPGFQVAGFSDVFEHVTLKADGRRADEIIPANGMMIPPQAQSSYSHIICACFR